MSTDYIIFVQSQTKSSEEILNPILDIAGVEYQNGLRISGLVDVSCKQLSQHYRSIMLEEYGQYGLSVDWNIMGTYDKSTDIFRVVEILYRCVAAYINRYPNNNLSLMRNGEDFYAYNTHDMLMISPIYIESIPIIKSLFNKKYVIKDIFY